MKTAHDTGEFAAEAMEAEEKIRHLKSKEVSSEGLFGALLN